MHQMIRKGFVLRALAVCLANIAMGFFLTWILRVHLGSDPASTMHSGVSSHLPISYGTWALLFNLALLALVWRRKPSRIGVGTLANMTLCGYTVDFCDWLIDGRIPDSFFQPWPVRIAICVPALICFILSVAVYLNLDMGASPYDAMPELITDALHGKAAFQTVRTGWDIAMLVIGVAAGASFGIVTVILALSLGAAISHLSPWVRRMLPAMS